VDDTDSEVVEITLEQLLASRDERQALEKTLIERHKGCTLVVLTVVMPGSVKRNDSSLIVARAAVEALHKAFQGHIRYEEKRDLATGYEAFMMTDLPTDEAKRTACHVENSHPLGRLFDIDVFTADGQPISRASIGRASRRCLICEKDARVCMREHNHSYEELHAKINQLIQAYVRRV